MKDSNDKKTIDMLKPAPKTNAERQRAYREKIKNNNSQRLDVYLDKSVADKLADIVAAVGDSQKDVLSRLIEKEYTLIKSSQQRLILIFAEYKLMFVGKTADSLAHWMRYFLHYLTTSLR